MRAAAEAAQVKALREARQAAAAELAAVRAAAEAAQVKALSEARQAAAAELAAAEAAAAELVAVNEAAQATQAAQEVKALREARKAAAVEVAERDAMIAALRKEAADLLARIDTLTKELARIDTLTKELAHARAEGERATARAEAAEREQAERAAELEAAAATLTARFEGGRKACENSDACSQDLRVRLGELEAKRAALEVEVQSLGARRLADLKASLANAESLCTKLQSLADDVGEVLTLWSWVPEAMRCFHEIDADGSGTIESEELMIYMLGKNKDVQTITELFKFMDEDNNGKIDKCEWLAGYHEYAEEATTRGHRPSKWQCNVMLSWLENKPLTEYMENEEEEPPLDLKAHGLPTREQLVKAIDAIQGHAKEKVATLRDAIVQVDLSAM